MTCLATLHCLRENRIFVFTTAATLSFVLALPFPFSSLTYGYQSGTQGDALRPYPDMLHNLEYGQH